MRPPGPRTPLDRTPLNRTRPTRTRPTRTRLALVALATALLVGSTSARTVTISTSAQPETLDPHVTSATSSFQTMKSIYDTLVEADRNAVIVPALAHSWTVSEDGLSLTFALREGVRFHDGSELDAADVAASIRRLQAETSPKADEFDMIVGIATPDPLTVELRLDRPAPALLDSFASGWGAILPAELIEADHDFGNRPVGTGPYTFAEWVRDSFVRLTANPDYYGGAPAVDEVVIRYVADPAVQFQGLQTGEFDIAVDIAAVDWPSVERDDRFVLEQGPSGLVLVSALNTRRPYLEDPRVRQALNYAVDAETVLEVAYGGGFPVGTFMEAGSPWLPETIEPYPYDPERARELLAEAGVPSGWTLDMALPQPYDTHITAGQVIQDMLGEVGIDVDIRIVEWGVWLGEIYTNARDFDMTVIGHTGKLDASGRLGGYGRPERTYHGFDDAEVADMVDRAAVSSDPGERAELYARILTALHEEPPFIYIGTPFTTFARRADVDGFWITPLLDTFDLRSLTVD
jgi:peptide/nickel transport system substrate-binding protein